MALITPSTYLMRCHWRDGTAPKRRDATRRCNKPQYEPHMRCVDSRKRRVLLVNTCSFLRAMVSMRLVISAHDIAGEPRHSSCPKLDLSIPDQTSQGRRQAGYGSAEDFFGWSVGCRRIWVSVQKPILRTYSFFIMAWGSEAFRRIWSSHCTISFLRSTYFSRYIPRLSGIDLGCAPRLQFSKAAHATCYSSRGPLCNVLLELNPAQLVYGWDFWLTTAAVTVKNGARKTGIGNGRRVRMSSYYLHMPEWRDCHEQIDTAIPLFIQDKQRMNAPVLSLVTDNEPTSRFSLASTLKRPGDYPLDLLRVGATPISCPSTKTTNKVRGKYVYPLTWDFQGNKSGYIETASSIIAVIKVQRQRQLMPPFHASIISHRTEHLTSESTDTWSPGPVNVREPRLDLRPVDRPFLKEKKRRCDLNRTLCFWNSPLESFTRHFNSIMPLTSSAEWHTALTFVPGIPVTFTDHHSLPFRYYSRLANPQIGVGNPILGRLRENGPARHNVLTQTPYRM
ncbi:hypothetical protein ACRALDRAFT_209740 [Sodiomyces alcalophilus JCM 7366]|uniref:uncharacterized protein n=1 Tax=Sodiomyces alcalophilus JCM 7366 TaxID=591952 RepID=UPI0039B3C253